MGPGPGTAVDWELLQEEGLAPPEGEEQAEEPLQFSFRIFGHIYRLTLRQWAVATGLYFEPETVTPLYTEAVTEVDKEDFLVFWGLISDSPWLGTNGRVLGIRDPLYRYLHRRISTSIIPRQKSREWCTDRDLFFLYCLLTGTRLKHGEWHAHHAPIPGARPSVSRGRPGPGLGPGAVAADAGTGGPAMLDPPHGVPHQRSQPHVEHVHDQPPQHPRHVRRSVRLNRATQALLDGLVADSRRQARHSERMEKLVIWAVGRLVDLSRAAGIEPPPLPPPRQYPGDPGQDEGGVCQDEGGACQDEGGVGQDDGGAGQV
ncbi:hypothetical protein L1987_01019 [Smallanthus sonchifolius]|uniref:Uncharacterized protein n=1 Tax=Smallanthus sonchifolius TaxID=185202 RepID=A0ACB9K3X2_9ASTR|nr:hypothetical protein L1987_01019 [Smallanthus sonchifolius]